MRVHARVCLSACVRVRIHASACALCVCARARARLPAWTLACVPGRLRACAGVRMWALTGARSLKIHLVNTLNYYLIIHDINQSEKPDFRVPGKSDCLN